MELLHNDSTNNNLKTYNFILLCLVLLFIFICIPDNYFEPLTFLMAKMVCGILNAIGVQTVTFDSYVYSPKFQINIISECTPIIPIFIYSAFVLTQQQKTISKFNGLFFGIFILFATNLFRLLATFIISMYKPSLFSIIHLYLGQLMTSGVLIALCIGWLQSDKEKILRDTPQFFLIKVALILGVLYVPWLYFYTFYIQSINFIVSAIISLFGQDAHISLRANEMPLSAFDVITYSSLILASKSIKKKTASLIIGLTILALFQTASNFCLLGNQVNPKIIWCIGFKVVSLIHFVLPYIMWIFIVGNILNISGHVPIRR